MHYIKLFNKCKGRRIKCEHWFQLHRQIILFDSSSSKLESPSTSTLLVVRFLLWQWWMALVMTALIWSGLLRVREYSYKSNKNACCQVTWSKWYLYSTFYSSRCILWYFNSVCWFCDTYVQYKLSWIFSSMCGNEKKDMIHTMHSRKLKWTYSDFWLWQEPKESRCLSVRPSCVVFLAF